MARFVFGRHIEGVNNMMRWTGGKIFFTGAFLAALAITAAAGGNSAAQQNTAGNAELGEPSDRHGDWDIKLGAGVMVAPRYEGSDTYVALPIPALGIAWRGIVSLGQGGLEVNALRGSNYRFGAGLTYNPGRTEKGSSFFGTDLYGANHDLRGMGDIDAALGVRAFGSYTLGPVSLNASITKFTGEQNDGLLVNTGVSLPLHPWKRLVVSPSVSSTWADDNYMQTFFGVSAQQSARSGLPAYNAGAGIKDVTVGLNASYLFDHHWFLMTNTGVKQLLDDAQDSPITHESTSPVFSSVVGYRF
jgi:MipA family protein